MRLIVITFLVFINSIICIDENNNSKRFLQARYSVNHPPLAEDYNPIPVTVVYEDEVIIRKSSSEVADEINDSGIQKVYNDETEKPTTELTHPEIGESKAKGDIILKPKARALSELQIPVAVKYDSLPDQNAASSENTNPRRLKQRRRKLQNKTNVENTVNDKSQITITQSTELKPRRQNVHDVKRTQYIEPQIQKVDSIKESSKARINIGPRKGGRDPIVPIVESENYVFSHSGRFHYSYEGGDGTKAFSEGHQLRNEDNEATGEAVSGGFSYTDKDGNDFSVSYTADENGYRPVGAHLPTPPPIPPAIARALAYLATATTPEPVTKNPIKQAIQNKQS